ncbi:MAG: hypothetical protein QOJ10_1012, partial [Chloroflexota bacterium]|nr:hypothetical protein [Chloroflexota bacterium]
VAIAPGLDQLRLDAVVESHGADCHIRGATRGPAERFGHQVAQMGVQHRATERAHPWMRKRVAQGMRSQMGRMGAKDPVGISDCTSHLVLAGASN